MKTAATIAGTAAIIACIASASANAAPSDDGSTNQVMMQPTGQGNVSVNEAGMQSVSECFVVGVPAAPYARYPRTQPKPLAKTLSVPGWLVAQC
jgi:hypothetical protein